MSRGSITKSTYKVLWIIFLFSGIFLDIASENDRVIPNSYLLLGTINNGSQPNILSWEPLVMAPNPIF